MLYIVRYLSEGVEIASATFTNEDAAISAGCAWVGNGCYDRGYTTEKVEG